MSCEAVFLWPCLESELHYDAKPTLGACEPKRPGFLLPVPDSLRHLSHHSNISLNLRLRGAMCGIYFSLSCSQFLSPDGVTVQLLQHRGPDSIHRCQQCYSIIEQTSGHGLGAVLESTHRGYIYASFVSTVLSLRGTSIVTQPLHHTNGSVLCWNGEAWAIGGRAVEGNDSQAVFTHLLEASSAKSFINRSYSIGRVIEAVSDIRGPFSFVFYDWPNKYAYYGRDCLGRRSLLRKSMPTDEVVLSSVADNSTGEQWAEVEADGLYVVDISLESGELHTTRIPLHPEDSKHMGKLSLVGEFPLI